MLLTLTIKREYFDAIKSGEKTREYRIANKFYASRIEDKQIDRILLKNGYSRDAPQILIECLKITKERLKVPIYGNTKQEFYVLHLGKIIDG
jgi:ASC-1-like (ASCH) protein